MDNYVRQCTNKKKANCQCKLNPRFGNDNDGLVLIPEKKTIIAPVRNTHDKCTYNCIDFFNVKATPALEAVTKSLVTYRFSVSPKTFAKDQCVSFNFNVPNRSGMTPKEYRSLRRFCKREGMAIAAKQYPQYAKHLSALIALDRNKNTK